MTTSEKPQRRYGHDKLPTYRQCKEIRDRCDAWLEARGLGKPLNWREAQRRAMS